MKKAGRLMQWQEFKQAQANGMGTAIGEYLSTKGPFRLWWTPDDIHAKSPHEWKREQHVAWMESEFLPFFSGVTHDTQILTAAWLNWSSFQKNSETN